MPHDHYNTLSAAQAQALKEFQEKKQRDRKKTIQLKEPKIGFFEKMNKFLCCLTPPPNPSKSKPLLSIEDDIPEWVPPLTKAR